MTGTHPPVPAARRNAAPPGACRLAPAVAGDVADLAHDLADVVGVDEGPDLPRKTWSICRRTLGGRPHDEPAQCAHQMPVERLRLSK